MYCWMLEPLALCWRILGTGASFFGGCGFCLDSLYWPKVPISATFLRWRPAGVGLEFAFRRCKVLPFFSIVRWRMIPINKGFDTYEKGME